MIIDLTWVSMILIVVAVGLSLFLMYLNKVNLKKEVTISILRMISQLFLMGLVLQFLFAKENHLLTTCWLMVMIFFANHNIVKKCKLQMKPIWWISFISIFMGASSVLMFLILVIIQPKPLFAAQYAIPLFGMILGNSMNSIILAIEKFHSSIKSQKNNILTQIGLGATSDEACSKLASDAFRVALLPIISTMSTMGLVSIPGMMTGQILGGNSPMTAIKYQIVIILGIFIAISIATHLILKQLKSIFFDHNDMPIEKYFHS